MKGATAEKRYKELGLSDALSRPYDYPAACHELSLILRLAYAKLPKNLQSLILRDTLSAFRLLPKVQTTSGISSANLLVQAAEVSLPKQKKALAVSEFKHAVVATKRRGKAHQDGGPVQLPEDALVHIFSFLDMRSLVNVGLVCWAWNSAASDNMLWRLQYTLMLGEYDIFCKSKERTHKLLQDEKATVFHQSIEGVDPPTNIDWREAFQRKYVGNSTWRSRSQRVVCGHCASIIWRSHMTCAMSHHCPKLENQKLKIKPVSAYKVVKYLLGESELNMSSSDSDDNGSDGSSSPVSLRISRLWAYPRLTSGEEQPLRI